MTLLEAMLLLVVMSITAVAVAICAQALTDGAEGNDNEQAISTEIMSELEQWRATPFTTLSTTGNLTDTVALQIRGGTRKFTRKRVIQRMDPTNPSTNASPQPDFLQVQVTIGDRTALLWVTQQ